MNKNLTSSRGASAKSTLQNIYIYLFLFVVVLVFSFISAEGTTWFGRGHFLSPNSLISLIRASSPIIALACGFTFIMIAGYMDLSVGSAMSLTGVIYALVIRAGCPFIVGLLAAIGTGIVCGLINSSLVTRLRITPVIATLITMTGFKGISLLIVPDGVSGIKSTDVLKMPEWISSYGRGNFLFGLPLAFYISILLVIIVVIIQRKTVIGKYSAAIGGNATSAELSGISIVKYVSILYVITGVLSAFAGVALASYSGMGNPLGGDGMETNCIIAVLLGGAAFTGGEGSTFKSVIGALIIMCLTTGLLTVVDSYYMGFLKGAVLIFAVTMNKLLSNNNH